MCFHLEPGHFITRRRSRWPTPTSAHTTLRHTIAARDAPRCLILPRIQADLDVHDHRDRTLLVNAIIHNDYKMYQACALLDSWRGGDFWTACSHSPGPSQALMYSRSVSARTTINSIHPPARPPARPLHKPFHPSTHLPSPPTRLCTSPPTHLFIYSPVVTVVVTLPPPPVQLLVMAGANPHLPSECGARIFPIHAGTPRHHPATSTPQALPWVRIAQRA